MPITNYYSVNGELIGEKVGTNARVDYLTDALGNVTATLNQSGQVVNTYRYKPYGDLLAKTGAGPDPAFQWVGAQGYRKTEKKYSDVYVRARHYDTIGGRWTSKDPIWYFLVRHHRNPTGQYAQSTGQVYSQCSPVSLVDPIGLKPKRIPPIKHGPVPSECKCVNNRVDCNGTDYGNGFSGCDAYTGKTYLLVCTTGCERSCVEAHEAQHEYDFKTCCSRLAKCNQKYPDWICEELYSNWFDNTRYWVECRGFRVALGCVEDLIRKGDCWNQSTDCCKRLCAYYYTELLGVKNWCKDITNPWTPPPYSCPFSADGTIDWLL